jgi:hypothetical protein
MHTFIAEAGACLVPNSTGSKLLAAAEIWNNYACPFVLEFYLSQGTDRVDLTYRIFPEMRDRILKDRFLVSDAISHFFEAWSKHDGPLSLLPYIELEYDIVDDLGEPWIGPAVEPSVALGPMGIYRASKETPCYKVQRAMISKAVLENLPIAPPSRPLVERLEGMYEALPEMGFINHMSALNARPSNPAREGIRLILSIPRHALGDYLTAIDWRGRIERIEEEINWFKPYAARVSFDLNIKEDSGGDTIAIYNEFIAPRDANSYLGDSINALHNAGYLSNSEKDAIRHWVRVSDGRLDRALTFKLGWKGDEAARAKLYLSQLK